VPIGQAAFTKVPVRQDAKTFRKLVAGFDTSVSAFFDKWRNGRTNAGGEIGRGKKDGGKRGIVFSKTFLGGRVITVQFDNRGRGVMEIKTMYVKKEGTTSVPCESAMAKTSTLRPERTEPVSSFDNHTISQSADSVKKDVLSDILTGRKRVEQSGREIAISRIGIDKFLSGRINHDKYASGFHIPELVTRATLVGQAENYHPETAGNIPTFEYYDSPIMIDGRQYNAHIRVKNTNVGDRYYGHTVSEVTDIEIEPSARTSVPENPAVQPVNAIDGSIGLKESPSLDTGKAPAAAEIQSVPVEGTRPLNSDFTIQRGAENVKKDTLAKRRTLALRNMTTLGAPARALQRPAWREPHRPADWQTPCRITSTRRQSPA